jgi:two-component system OmpR family sensor kinase
MDASGAPYFPMTIRLRLTLWYTALLGATLILFSFVVYTALAAHLWSQAQQDAAKQATEVSRALSEQLQGNILIIRVNPTRIQFPDLDFFTSSLGVQFVDLNGMIIKRSNNLGPVSVQNYSQALEAIRNGQNHMFYTTDEKGMPLLVSSAPVIANRTIVGAVQVIKPVGEVRRTLNQVSRYLTFGTALSLVLAAIVGAFLARRALAPIEQIANLASSISGAQDLSRRIDIPMDESEVGRLAATFNEMMSRIERLFLTQQRLIADVSHELRTPLTTIQGNVGLLRRATSAATSEAARTNLTKEVMQESLTEVEEETTRMGRMVSDLLLLAQADSGMLQVHMEPVEMDTLLLEVYRQTRRIAEQTRGPGALDIRLGTEDQAMVMGDQERLRQVLLNLAENAVKYTLDGGTVTLSLENRENWVTVSVSDTGIGIKPEQQQAIFERFFRTDKARSRELGGSGLGLSIVQSIAQAHGGKITVSSVPNEGSTFVLWLPDFEHTKQVLAQASSTGEEP